MKKQIIFACTISLILTLAGCSNNDEYIIEKKYWKTQRQAGKIFKNPHSSPPRELERVVCLLNNFAQKYPKTKLAVDADFSIARLYIVKEEYDKARAQLKLMLNKYAKSDFISSEAIFLIGNTYQIENKWDLALEQYRKIMQSYSTTLRGLDMPIYIAQYYKIKYQPDKMIATFQEAIDYYKNMAKNHPNSPLSYRAETLVAESYLALKDWQSAIDSFEQIISSYKNKIPMDGVMLTMALIYSKELKDNTKAKEILNRLIKEYPRSKLIKTAHAALKQLDKK